MTSHKTNIIGLASAQYIATDINGATSARTATGKTITAAFPTRFRTATAQAICANVGDMVWLQGEVQNAGAGFYAYAVMTQKNATVDGVAAQDEYFLVGTGGWRHKNPALMGSVPLATATFSTWRISTGTQPAPPMNSYGGIIIESIVCTRNTTAGAGTLTITELDNTASGLTASPIVVSVQTAATFSADSIPIPADGWQFNGPVLFNPNANTSDWIVTWRGRWPVRNISYLTPT